MRVNLASARGLLVASGAKRRILLVGAEKLSFYLNGNERSTAVLFGDGAGAIVLEADSDINSNPEDSKDHPEGVWTLAPGYALGEVDKDKYRAIGESDRMTLRFRKAN